MGYGTTIIIIIIIIIITANQYALEGDSKR